MNLNYEATFGPEVLPFRISVDEQFLNTTKLKVSLTRFVDTELEQTDFTDGPPTKKARELAKYWAEEYDWRAVEANLNAELQQFAVVVRPSTSPANFMGDVPLHFVHHKSSRANAIPLLFVHGWPGSFLEVIPIIKQLTDPPEDSLPAFHVVAPSIPGYGFSPSPQVPGMGYRAVAAAFHALMTEKLGYDKYVFQGGDAGDLINRYAAHDFPESVVSGLSNFWVVPPTDEDLRMSRQHEFTEDSDEQYFCAHWSDFFRSSWGYAQIQQTRPLKLAQGLTDSPVGLAMWIYDAVFAGIGPARRDEVWTLDRVITWTMMEWLNGPYGAISLYKQGAKVSRNHTQMRSAQIRRQSVRDEERYSQRSGRSDKH
jgi:pimeloyl-ACP methyl ester carboxylesterase